LRLFAVKFLYCLIIVDKQIVFIKIFTKHLGNVYVQSKIVD